MKPEDIETAARELFDRERDGWSTYTPWDELAEETKQIWRYHVVKRQARAEAREEVAAWAISLSLTTGHADTLGELLGELREQVEALRQAGADVGELKALLKAHHMLSIEDFPDYRTGDDLFDRTIRSLKR